jgi:hypothetical protein
MKLEYSSLTPSKPPVEAVTWIGCLMEDPSARDAVTWTEAFGFF